MISLDERTKLIRRHELLLDFLGSEIHILYVKSTQAQIDFEQARILDDPTTTSEEWLELRAQRRILQANLTFFEDIISTLENQIQEILPDLENPNEIQEETE